MLRAEACDTRSKVSFRKVENVKPIQHAGVHDAQARSFGCMFVFLDHLKSA